MQIKQGQVTQGILRLFMAMIAVSLLYLMGCVAIPDQAYVLSGGYNRALEPMIGSCGEAGIESGVLNGSSSAIDPYGFSILSWNVHKGRRLGWQADLASLAVGTDLLLLQEASFDERFREQLRLMDNDWLLATAFQSGVKDVGIMSAGRVSPLTYCAMRTLEPLIRIPKMALASTYPLLGEPDELLVINVHVINFTVGIEAVRRQIGAMKEMVEAHRGPVIIAGDFNTWSNGRTTLIESEMVGLGLQQVLFSPDNRTQFLDRTVDAIYYRGLEVVDSLSQMVGTSDHNPLKVHFRVFTEERG